MNIVFHRYGNICEPDIMESFSKIGLNIIEDDMEVENKSIPGDVRVEIISRLILENSPLFVFSINFFPYISEICNRLNVLYICWTVDSPVLELYSDSIANKTNRIFLFDYKQYLLFKDKNPEGIFYLPLATNIGRWKNELGETITDPDYLYDISFVGSLYDENLVYSRIRIPTELRLMVDDLLRKQMQTERLEILEENLTDETINLIWETLRKDEPSFADKYMLNRDKNEVRKVFVINNLLGFDISSRERLAVIKAASEVGQTHVFSKSQKTLSSSTVFHGPVSTHKEMPRVFSTSKINLNITMRGIQTGISQRVWDVLGCGGFLMSDYQEEIPEYFDIGKDLVCFKNEKECKELTDHYLHNDAERKEIALNGYKKVLQYHSYDLRVSQMLKKAFNS